MAEAWWRCGTEETKSKVVLGEVHSEENGGRIIKFEAMDVDSGEIVKIPFTLSRLAGASSILSIGSVIYVIGRQSPINDGVGVGNGYHQMHNGISYFDLSKPEFGWKKAPFIDENHVFMPNCVSCCGKIFVFSNSNSNSNSNCSSFADVFDPQLNYWTPLLDSPPVSGTFNISYPVISDPCHGCVIIRIFTKDKNDPMSCIYAYYPPNAPQTKGRWECLDNNYIGVWTSPMAVVDRVIYFNYPKLNELIEAYDLVTNQWFEVVLSSQFDLPFKIEFDAMHHLGDGVLCLTTFCLKLQNLDNTKDHTLVSAVKFKVEPSLSDQKLLVTPLSYKSSPLDTCCEVFGYLAI